MGELAGYEEKGMLGGVIYIGEVRRVTGKKIRLTLLPVTMT